MIDPFDPEELKTVLEQLSHKDFESFIPKQNRLLISKVIEALAETLNEQFIETEPGPAMNGIGRAQVAMISLRPWVRGLARTAERARKRAEAQGSLNARNDLIQMGHPKPTESMVAAQTAIGYPEVLEAQDAEDSIKTINDIIEELKHSVDSRASILKEISCNFRANLKDE
jgi:hypothetical protein